MSVHIKLKFHICALHCTPIKQLSWKIFSLVMKKKVIWKPSISNHALTHTPPRRFSPHERLARLAEETRRWCTVSTRVTSRGAGSTTPEHCHQHQVPLSPQLSGKVPPFSTRCGSQGRITTAQTTSAAALTALASTGRVKVAQKNKQKQKPPCGQRQKGQASAWMPPPSLLTALQQWPMRQLITD